jgi:tetratricopeptide (TPR) repeat protein
MRQNPADSPSVSRRVATWYLHALASANRTLDPRHRPLVPLVDRTGQQPAPEFATPEQALAWCEAERVNLVAVVRVAADRGSPDVAWQLAATLRPFCRLRGYRDDWLETHRIGRAAADLSDSPLGRATMLRGMGTAYCDLRTYAESVASHRTADAIYQESHDTAGRAWNLNDLAVTYVAAGCHDLAIDCLLRALPLFQATGDGQGEAVCRSNLGDAQRSLRQYEDAAGQLRRAREIQRTLGDDGSRRFTLVVLGDLYRDIGAPDSALDCYQQMLSASEEIGDRQNSAQAHYRIGSVYDALGNGTIARSHWRKAYTIVSEYDSPHAFRLRGLLSR